MSIPPQNRFKWLAGVFSLVFVLVLTLTTTGNWSLYWEPGGHLSLELTGQSCCDKSSSLGTQADAIAEQPCKKCTDVPITLKNQLQQNVLAQTAFAHEHNEHVVQYVVLPRLNICLLGFSGITLEALLAQPPPLSWTLASLKTVILVI